MVSHNVQVLRLLQHKTPPNIYQSSAPKKRGLASNREMLPICSQFISTSGSISNSAHSQEANATPSVWHHLTWPQIHRVCAAIWHMCPESAWLGRFGLSLPGPSALQMETLHSGSVVPVSMDILHLKARDDLQHAHTLARLGATSPARVTLPEPGHVYQQSCIYNYI